MKNELNVSENDNLLLKSSIWNTYANEDLTVHEFPFILIPSRVQFLTSTLKSLHETVYDWMCQYCWKWLTDEYQAHCIVKKKNL